MKGQTTLYTYALSPYGMKVYWAFVYKGMSFNIQYVSPINQNEIAFTNQRVVPVVKNAEKWKLDSGSICCWLDEIHPERLIAGASESEKRAIQEADEWVTRNIIGLCFRSVIDDDKFFSAFRNGRKLSRVMRKTSGGIPSWTQFVWYKLLRKRAFVLKDANQVDRSVSVAAGRETILNELEARIGKTRYLAGTETPSYADISLFAQLVCCTTLEMEGALTANSSPTLKRYYDEMCEQFELTNKPELVPGWQPYGLT